MFCLIFQDYFSVWLDSYGDGRDDDSSRAYRDTDNGKEYSDDSVGDDDDEEVIRDSDSDGDYETASDADDDSGEGIWNKTGCINHSRLMIVSQSNRIFERIFR